MNEPQRHLAAIAPSPSNAAEALAAPAVGWREQLSKLIDPRSMTSAARAAAAGYAFDLRAFHSRALAVGGVRLDTLQRVLRGEFGA